MSASGGTQLGLSESADDRALPRDSMPSLPLCLHASRECPENLSAWFAQPLQPHRMSCSNALQAVPCAFLVHMPAVNMPQLIRHCSLSHGIDGL